MFDALLQALTLIFTPVGILALLAGAAIGLTFGILPGLGASQAMILLLPFTYGADPDYAILMFVAIMSAASFGGSLPAILINTPGTPANVCTTFDGHPMARRGEATRAIFISSASCLVGSIVGATALYALIPVIGAIINEFGTRETFWLVLFGIAMISLASKGNTVKGLVAGGVGLLLAFVGRNFVFPGERFTGGMGFLYDGIPMIALLVGVFAVTPMIFIGARRYVVDQASSQAAAASTSTQGSYARQARQGLADVARRPFRALSGSLVGVLLGIIPAVGGATASFINYLMNKQTSKNGDEYGRGHPEGLIASETANDAKDGGAFMPTLAFGIPGDVNTAVLLGALLMHGVSIGNTLFNHELHLVMIIVLALVLGQVAVAFMGAAAGPLVTRVTTVNTSYLVPVVVTFAFVGSYLFRGSIWDITIVVIMAAFGYFLHLFNYPAIALVLGFLLGVDAERSFVQTLTISQGSYSGFFEGYIVWIIIGVMAASFAFTGIIGRRRRKAFKDAAAGARGELNGDGEPEGTPGDSGETSSAVDPAQDPPGGGTATKTAERAAATEAPPGRERLIGLGFAVFLLVMSVAFLLGSLTYEGDTGRFPLIVSAVTTALLAVVLAAELSPRVRAAVERIDAGTPDVSNGEDAPDFSTATLVNHAQIVGWAVLFVVAVMALGFLAFPVLIFAYIVQRGGLGAWRSGAVVAVLVGVALVLMGVAAPQMYWQGSIITVIPGFLGGSVLPSLF